MLDVLNQILCWIEAIANMALWAIMSGANAIISGIGSALGAVISFLPDMPTTPSWTGITTDVFGYANWAFPVGFLVTAVAGLAILWLAWQALAALLRWGKVVA